ncbi:RNA-binding protein YhbY [Candidatus Pseudothioglobus singularis PS1]|jgi:RNA-binding protein|uniref:RNA-binding protein YhbY n=2 Tax=Candidatus Pseudothioglobus TaxID=2841677 RepID=A0A0M3T1N1_9GAMM|nr:RNA-binding protein YhbY [Candidatus Pseudothioglobus singularis PS1]|tara:strand:+ start:992 stop:1309 length:318 start_codon:yes stop_codon:yes gene_type:complete
MKLYLKMKLTNNQKKYLRSLAHDLKPFVMIGQHGLSESVIAEIESTMLKHELIKIKLRVSDRDEKQGIINKIIKFSEAELVQVIGGVIVIYRPFEDNPDIILPRS